MMARDLKFRTLEVGELTYLCSENKEADQLRGSEICKKACFFIHGSNRLGCKRWYFVQGARETVSFKNVTLCSNECGLCPTFSRLSLHQTDKELMNAYVATCRFPKQPPVSAHHTFTCFMNE